LTNPCPKCGHDPNIDSDFIFNYANDIDKILVGCPRCGYTWLIKPEDDKPPEGLDI